MKYQPKIDFLAELEAQSKHKVQLLLSQSKEQATVAPDNGIVVF